MVVGGASGMGRATAVRLASLGARVAVLDRPAADGAAVASELGSGSAFYRCDVTDAAGTEQAIQAAVDELGGLRVAVNTAGGGISKRTRANDGQYASLAVAIVENQMLNGGTIRLDGGQRFAPK